MKFTERYRQEAAEAIEKIDLEQVDHVIRWFEETRASRRHIFVFGNGGSASLASHLASEVLKGASQNREPRFRIIALNDALPTILAYANDVSYDAVFVEQLKNFAQPDDLVIGISSSGNSTNVVRAVEYANSVGCRTVALTGQNDGKLGDLAHFSVRAKQSHTGHIEDTLHVVCHMIAYYFMES